MRRAYHKSQKEIFKPNTMVVEDLPYPYVLYPGPIGAFFAFCQNQYSEPTFCACSLVSIENYINMRLNKTIQNNIDPTRMYILDSFDFPLIVVKDLMLKDVKNDEVIQHLKFTNKLCHECNKVTPRYRYCHEIYGGAFKQNYGWYIKKQFFEWGVDPYFDIKACIKDAIPEEILSILDSDFVKELRFSRAKLQEAQRKLQIDTLELSHEKGVDILRKRIEYHDESRNVESKLTPMFRKIKNLVENEVRRKFEFKNVGEAWTSETILYFIIRTLLPNVNIERHYRPTILRGLELDIFIPEYNIGIEYQGIQHFMPIKHWGGVKGFKKLQERDLLKVDLCKLNKIRLIHFNYWEELSNENVRKKIEPIINI